MLILNKKNVIIKILIIFFIIMNAFVANSFAVVKPTADFYVNDYAGLLSQETKNYIINTNKSLCSKTGAQIVVVTIPNLENNSLEEYATELFRNFGIGDKNKNNGVLLLLSLQERKFRVEVGYGLEGILPDAKTGRIQDEYIIPYLKQNNWNDGIKNGFSAFLDVISKEYNVEVGGETPIATEDAKSNTENSNILMIGFIGIPMISLVIGVITLLSITSTFSSLLSSLNKSGFNFSNLLVSSNSLFFLSFLPKNKITKNNITNITIASIK